MVNAPTSFTLVEDLGRRDGVIDAEKSSEYSPRVRDVLALYGH